MVAISCRKPTAPIVQSPAVIWARTFGGDFTDEGISVQETSSGEYIIAGYTSVDYLQYDAYLIKVDRDRILLWEKKYGGTGDDKAFSVCETTDGGYVVVGYTRSFGAGSYDVYLFKTDNNGDTVWTKAYGGYSHDEGKSVQHTMDGGFIMVGSTESFGSGLCDIYLIKTDEDGNLLWEKTYGGVKDDKGMSVQQTFDGGYIIGGITASFGNGNFDMYLIKTNGTGDIIWTKTYGLEDSDLCHSVQQLSDGDYIIVGRIMTLDSGFGDVWLLRTDANGDTLWTKTYGSSNKEDAYSVQQTKDAGFIIAGYTADIPYSTCYVIKTNSSGDTLWTTALEPGGLFSIQETSDYAYIAVGWTYGKSIDVYIVKIR